MNGYQSDSSEASDNEYTETNILLGYASKQASENDTSFLGGRPTWLDPATPPSASLAKCNVCNDSMVLLLQLNGDLPEIFPGHERRLYVFACRRSQCRRREGSVRGFRGVRYTSLGRKRERNEDVKVGKGEENNDLARTDIGEHLFGTNGLGKGNGSPFSSNGTGSPFASSDETVKTKTIFSQAEKEKPPKPPSTDPQRTIYDPTPTLPQTFASALNLNLPASLPTPTREPWPSDSALPPAYPISYLSEADYEVLESPSKPTSISQKGTLDFDDSPTGAGGKEDRDVFESSLDKTFQRFADRIAQNPEQCIRYQFGGEVLLYSKTDAVGKLLSSYAVGEEARTSNGSGQGMKGIPRCGNCGSERKFEVQIMPHAIMVLEEGEEGMDGMEWGTEVVSVCGNDCMERGKGEGETGYLEEWVGVQWEETK